MPTNCLQQDKHGLDFDQLLFSTRTNGRELRTAGIQETNGEKINIVRILYQGKNTLIFYAYKGTFYTRSLEQSVILPLLHPTKSISFLAVPFYSVIVSSH